MALAVGDLVRGHGFDRGLHQRRRDGVERAFGRGVAAHREHQHAAAFRPAERERRVAGLRLRQHDDVERQALPQWIAQRLAAQGQRVQPGEEGQRTLQFFADSVEGNLLAAHQEIQKLGLLYPAGDRSDGAPGVLSFEQVESAVLNVARYDVFKLSEAVLGGQAARAQRMLDGLKAEGEAAVLVHYTLSEDIRALKRVKDAMAGGRPLPMALREQRIWGFKERLFERVLPRLSGVALDNLLYSAHLVDGIVKGLKVPDWPAEGWQALHRLAMQLCQECLAPSPSGRAGAGPRAMPPP